MGRRFEDEFPEWWLFFLRKRVVSRDCDLVGCVVEPIGLGWDVYLRMTGSDCWLAWTHGVALGLTSDGYTGHVTSLSAGVAEIELLSFFALLR